MASKDSNLDELPAYQEDTRAPQGGGDLPAMEDLPAMQADDGGYSKAPWYSKLLDYNWNTKEKLKPVDPEKTPVDDDAIGKNLGYPGGYISTAAVQGAKELLNRMGATNQGGSMADLAAAAKGEAKSVPQQLKESGAPTAIAYAAGLPMQAVMDPFADAVELPKLLAPSTATKAVGEATEEGLVKNALKDVDRAFGKKKAWMGRRDENPFTTFVLEQQRSATPMWEEGMTPGEMEKAFTDRIYGDTGGRMNQIWAQHKNLKIDPRQAQAELLPEIQEAMQHPENRDALQRIMEDFQAHNSNPSYAGGVSPDQATGMARISNNIATGKQGAIGDTSQRFSRDDLYKQLRGKYAQAMRGARDKAVTTADPSVAEDIARNNANYSVGKTAEKPLNQLLTKEQGKKLLSAFDLAGLGLSAADLAGRGGHELPYMLSALALKKLGQYAQSPGGAVRLGGAARNLGESSIWDTMAKQALQGRDKEQ